MRFSPLRTTVILRSDATVGSAEEAEQQPANNSATLVTEDGYRVVDAKTSFVPDPRLSSAGHAAITALYYFGFAIAIAYAAIIFTIGGSSQQTLAMPLTSSLQPSAKLRVTIACSSAAVVSAMSNYSAFEGSPCWRSSINTSGPLAVAAAADIAAPTEQEWRVLDGLPLCYVPSVPFSCLDGTPQLPGLMLRVSNPSTTTALPSLCVLDVVHADKGAFVTRLNLEPHVVKTLHLAYSRRSSKNDDMRIVSEVLTPGYYDLDGLRSSTAADGSSIVNVRFTEVSTTAVDFDPRTVFTVTGSFGCVWWLLSYPIFWMTPALFVVCKRNFFEDSTEGRVGGYTQDLLSRATRPADYIGFAGKVMGHVKFLQAQPK